MDEEHVYELLHTVHVHVCTYYTFAYFSKYKCVSCMYVHILCVHFHMQNQLHVTALHTASDCNIAQLLLERGADPNARMDVSMVTYLCICIS